MNTTASLPARSFLMYACPSSNGANCDTSFAAKARDCHNASAENRLASQHVRSRLGSVSTRLFHQARSSISTTGAAVRNRFEAPHSTTWAIRPGLGLDLDPIQPRFHADQIARPDAPDRIPLGARVSVSPCSLPMTSLALGRLCGTPHDFPRSTFGWPAIRRVQACSCRLAIRRFGRKMHVNPAELCFPWPRRGKIAAR